MAGLVFLEKHAVVHRDLKMSNLLCSADGNVIISDFGKAIMIDDSFKVQYTSGRFAKLSFAISHAHMLLSHMLTHAAV